jgi:signal transduction histidine kinase
MSILDPELLQAMRDLPLTAVVCGLILGLALWVTGWWLHRFWITLIATLTAGIIGLMYGPELGVKQAMVAGILLALAAGCLALSLARVALFLIYGAAVWYVMALALPQWAVPLICVTVGGLVSIWCFRLCMCLLTCSLASVLMSYAGLLLADQFLDFKATPHLQAYPWAEYVALGVIALLGVGLQFRLERAQQKAAQKKREQQEWKAKLEALKQEAVKQAEEEKALLGPRRKGWWPFGRRRAG